MSPPVIITRQLRANDVAARWFHAYKKDINRNEGEPAYFTGPNKKQIYEALVDLGDNPDPDTVDAVIGNKSWTSIGCDGCGAVNPPAVVRVGEEPDYESSTAHLCAPCLRVALAKIEEA